MKTCHLIIGLAENSMVWREYSGSLSLLVRDSVVGLLKS